MTHIKKLSKERFPRHSVTVALLADRGKVRNVFGTGANFVLYKPMSEERAEGTLRTAASLIRNERRTTFRVPVTGEKMFLEPLQSQRD